MIETRPTLTYDEAFARAHAERAAAFRALFGFGARALHRQRRWWPFWGQRLA